jgi:hypothetical protein
LKCPGSAENGGSHENRHVVGAAQPVDGDDVFLRRAGRLRGLDEPFYAAFLAASGSAHPMADNRDGRP